MIEFNQDIQLAVVMANHSRQGNTSGMRIIDDETMRRVISYVLAEQKVLDPGAVQARFAEKRRK